MAVIEVREPPKLRTGAGTEGVGHLLHRYAPELVERRHGRLQQAVEGPRPVDRAASLEKACNEVAAARACAERAAV